MLSRLCLRFDSVFTTSGMWSTLSNGYSTSLPQSSWRHSSAPPTALFSGSAPPSPSSSPGSTFSCFFRGKSCDVTIPVFSCYYVRHYARFDFFGIYVVMFMEILKTLLQVLLVFSILIVAFALTFYILFFQVVSACFLSLSRRTIVTCQVL